MSKISVLIPAYNHEKYIQETIQSIANQTYNDIELLIINDGSTDKTLEKINEIKVKYKNRFSRFVVQNQENQGTCVTLNKLLELAQGEYIFIIASDDKVQPNALEELYNFLSNNNDYALAVGENLLIDSESRLCYWDINRNIVYDKQKAIFKSFTDFLIKAKTGIVDFLSDEFGTYSSLLVGNYIPNGYLIRKNIFEKTGYYSKEAPLEDYYIMLQIAKYAKMKFLPMPLFYYRVHPGNTINQQSKINQMNTETSLYEIKSVLKSGNKEHLKLVNDYLTQLNNKHSNNYSIDISVILPVYNGEKYLVETINSILRQTYKNFELLCIDDSSTDNSLNILNDFAKKDTRIKILQKPNGGSAVKSIIHALPYAKGKYMFYTSQDDLFSDNLLEKMYIRATESNADAVIPDMAWYTGPAENYNGLSGVKGEKYLALTGKEAFIHSLDWTIHGFSLRKMDLVKKIGYDDLAMNSDEYITRKFYLNCNKVVFSEGIFFYRQDNANAITKKISIGLYDFIITNNRIIKLIIEAGCNNNVLKAFIADTFNLINGMKHNLKILKTTFSSNDYQKAQKIVNEGYRELISTAIEQKFYDLLKYKRKYSSKKVPVGLISVIIPAYNHEKYVQETINSIFEQTYQNIELLIIDDGSTDLTLTKINELKEKCKKRFKRLVIQTQQNKGTCETLNSLIGLAKGEYIYLIASDDKACPEALETLVNFLNENQDYALAVGENLLIDSHGKQCYWDKQRNNVYDIKKADYTSFSDFLIKNTQATDFLSDNFGSYSSLLMGNYIPNGYLIRKSIFEKTGYFNQEAPLEDYYLMMQISKYTKMKYIPVPMFYYRWHGENTVNQSEKMLELENQTRLFEIKKILASGDIEAITKLQMYFGKLGDKITEFARK